MIDLHLHTTASDGTLGPRELVALASARGLSVLAVTDHDTTAATGEVDEAARERGLEAVPGIEITAIEQGRDIHVLGYFIDPDDSALATFLAAQRQRRVARVAQITQRLAELGMTVALSHLTANAGNDSGRSIGRPQVARAMIAAGYARDMNEAFDRWLSPGRPGYVPREGPTIREVLDVVHAADGLASLAHPGKTRIDERIPALRDDGLDALEVFHSDHDAEARARYAELASHFGFLMTGGSDYHGDPLHGVEPGCSVVPPDVWERFRARGRRS